MYGSDFDSSTAAWPLDAVGAYVRLLNHQWEAGFVPDDLQGVASILRVTPSKARSLWWIVEQKLPVVATGRRANWRLAGLREQREEWSRKSSVGGKRGAATRATKGQPPLQPPFEPPLQPNGQPKGNTPDPFPIPSESPPPTHTPSGDSSECAREYGVFGSEDLAEAAFKVVLAKYPPGNVRSLPRAERAWSQALPFLPPLAVLLPSIERQKRSEQWQRKVVPDLAKWIDERMWTSTLGTEQVDSAATRYRRIAE
jgi:hypothetical protein